jgi:ribosome-binding protein aMBF1 (putative translation factor)
MTVTLNLTPQEVARLAAAASKTGLAPEALAEKMIREQLPVVSVADELSAKLQERHALDQIHFMPTRTATEIFAEWDREATLMTDEERDTEDQLWEDFQKGINQTRADLGMRQL